MPDYQPPTSLWEVSQQLRYNEPLSDPDDPRYVDTAPARTLGYHQWFRSLGVDPATGTLQARHASQYHLFCGHRGSGKSTELRRIQTQLNKPGLFRVILLDILEDLDVHSLQYPDVCLALAKRLFAELATADGIVIDAVFLAPLQAWFAERVRVSSAFSELKASVEAGVSGEVGIPFLSKFFAKATGSFQAGTSAKEEVRTLFKDSFRDFARAFNTLLVHVEERMARAWQTPRLLFIIDGTDRLDQADSQRFFVEDVHQLQQLRGMFI